MSEFWSPRMISWKKRWTVNAIRLVYSTLFPILGPLPMLYLLPGLPSSPLASHLEDSYSSFLVSSHTTSSNETFLGTLSWVVVFDRVSHSLLYHHYYCIDHCPEMTVLCLRTHLFISVSSMRDRRPDTYYVSCQLCCNENFAAVNL